MKVPLSHKPTIRWMAKRGETFTSLVFASSTLWLGLTGGFGNGLFVTESSANPVIRYYLAVLMLTFAPLALFFGIQAWATFKRLHGFRAYTADTMMQCGVVMKMVKYQLEMQFKRQEPQGSSLDIFLTRTANLLARYEYLLNEEAPPKEVIRLTGFEINELHKCLQQYAVGVYLDPNTRSTGFDSRMQRVEKFVNRIHALSKRHGIFLEPYEPPQH